MFLGARTLERYLVPAPRFSVLCFTRGQRGLLAEFLAPAAFRFGIGAKRRREIFEYLYGNFQLAEKPLRSEFGAQLIPRLMLLGVSNSLELLTEEESSELLDKMLQVSEAMSAAEKRRSGLRKAAKTPRGRKKRQVVMPRIRDNKL